MTARMRTSTMFLRFLIVGGSGFLIDAGVTLLLVRSSIVPWAARIPAIATAMLYTWIANRYFTYEAKTRPTHREAVAYFLVAIAMAALNFGIYVGLLNAGLFPITAVTLATICQTIASFFSYKRFVFGKRK